MSLRSIHFLNAVEVIASKLLDASLIVGLIWLLPKPLFALISVEQAKVVWLFLLFIAVESEIFKGWDSWKSQGAHQFELSVASIRLASRLKLFASAVIIFSVFFSRKESLLAGIWVINMIGWQHFSAADREILRLHSKFNWIVLFNIIQRSLLLISVLLSLFKSDQVTQLLILSIGGSVSTLIGLFGLRWRVLGLLGMQSSLRTFIKYKRETVTTLLTITKGGFSLWNHWCGVLSYATQTLDLLVLSLAHKSVEEVFLYSAFLRIASVSHWVPSAVSNSYFLALSEKLRSGNWTASSNLDSKYLRTQSWIVSGQVLLGILGSYALPWLLKSKTSPDFVRDNLLWFDFFLIGNALYQVGFQLVVKTILGQQARSLALRGYVTWVVSAGVTYFLFLHLFGITGLAAGNIVVGALFLFIAARYFYAGPKQ